MVTIKLKVYPSRTFSWSPGSIAGIDQETFIVSEIGKGAFEGQKLGAVTHPDSIVKVDTDAFKDCHRRRTLAILHKMAEHTLPLKRDVIEKMVERARS